jgi:FKBP-type peptidyl-prolyl cis-trans isomerase SlyD
MPLAIAPDTVVTLCYVLFDESGEAADRATASDPLVYTHGYGQIVPGLESGLIGLVAGDKRTITVGPEDGFGERFEEGVFEVDRQDFPDAASVVRGDEFTAESPEGGSVAMRVVDVLPDALVVDTNHPLAGQTLRFEVDIVDVREATDEELEAAHLELQAELEEGCCDDETHDHAGQAILGHAEPERLVRLAKKA